MNFDELRDQLRDQFQQTWERIQDSSIYITLKDRYDNLSPTGQKLATFGIVGLIALIVLLYPFDAFLRSTDYVAEFEAKRKLVSRMNETQVELGQGPNIPAPPPHSVLESRARQIFTSQRLLPKQIVSVSAQPAQSSIIPDALAAGGLLIKLSQLNLTQIVQIGRALEALHQSVKMKDLSINAGANDEGYFDVSFKLVPLAVPTDSSVAAARAEEGAETPERPAPRRRAQRSGGGTPPGDR